ncbi:hypothetical protein PHMEG_00011680 [Phytophthora megakarya]|uniref:Uncharacterized protein n=1 Tax=Phytophthora megakarya TaxID=4795 RepID=A0A225WD70_9STRA|nr:hypothetical protein PHMEG_00011680 [Phytophthora megakarya]
MTNQELDKTTDAATAEAGAPTAIQAPSEAASGSTTEEVVDVTADVVAWTDTPARVTSDPPSDPWVEARGETKGSLVDPEKTKKGNTKLVCDDIAPAPQAEVPKVAEERATSR